MANALPVLAIHNAALYRFSELCSLSSCIITKTLVWLDVMQIAFWASCYANQLSTEGLNLLTETVMLASTPHTARGMSKSHNASLK